MWDLRGALLQRLRAAVAAPTSKQVLYQRMTFADVTPGAYGGPPLRITSWSEGGQAPRHFRAAIGGLIVSRSGAGVATIVAGGTLGPKTVASFSVYRDGKRLARITPAAPPVGGEAFDPIGLVRTALAAADSQPAPIVTYNGKRIRAQLSLRDHQRIVGHIVYVVDRRTYEPVEIELPNVVQLSAYLNRGILVGGLMLLTPEFSGPG